MEEQKKRKGPGRPPVPTGQWAAATNRCPPETRRDHFGLAKYATKDRLLTDRMDKLEHDLWMAWRDSDQSIDEDAGKSCFVLHLDFTGIREIDSTVVSDCLVYSFGGIVLGSRSCYVVADGIAATAKTVAESIENALSKAKLVMIANDTWDKAPRGYKLIGYDKALTRYETRWRALAREDYWIVGGRFLKDKKDLTPRANKDILHDMYEDGVLMEGPRDRQIFRCPVSLRARSLLRGPSE